MLFGDTDVEAPLRVGRGEPVQAGRPEHRGGDRDEVLALRPDPHELVGEHRGPARPAGGRGRFPGDRVDHTRGVHLVGRVVLGRGEARALPGDRVHDDRATERLGPAEGGVEGAQVVSVHRPEVLQPEVLEHGLRADGVLEPAFRRVQTRVDRTADHGDALEGALPALQGAFVAGPQAQRRQVVREAADGGRVGPAVVVDHDHERAVAVAGDVVQRLPAHSTGQRAVTDHGHDVPAGALELVGLGEPVGVGERGRGVAVLHQVVFALGPRRVAGQPVPLPQPVEPSLTTRDDLVHVGLVPGVEDDGVVG